MQMKLAPVSRPQALIPLSRRGLGAKKNKAMGKDGERGTGAGRILET